MAPYSKAKIKGEHKPLAAPLKCDGAGSLGVIPDKYKHITPTYRVMCRECDKEFQPNYTGVVPTHKPGRMNFSFKIKWPQSCEIGSHYMPAGTRCRYLGTKLVCVAHA